MLHGNENFIKHKIGLLNLAEELGNMSKACRIMGYPVIHSIDNKMPLSKGASRLWSPSKTLPGLLVL